MSSSDLLITYFEKDSYFGGSPPLSEGVGWGVIIGFGVFFSLFTTIIVWLSHKYTDTKETSEHFNTAGRSVKTGLTAAVIVSQWTWAATLLQSSNVAWAYGVSGPFWYAAGASIQVLLFGVLAIRVKEIAPKAHTVCEMVRVRWGTGAHITFLCFSFMANIIVTAMLVLGGAAVVNSLTGVSYQMASFFIPWGVIAYTVAGGLKATFLASYIHTSVIMIILVVMIVQVYLKSYGSDQIYDMLEQTVSMTPAACAAHYSTASGSFYGDGSGYACGPVADNEGGSYLTMLSGGGLMFGIINIVGNFGTVFVDQSYWQSAIAAKPSAASRGYVLGGVVWFAIPFALATSLGLLSTALKLNISADEAGSGLVPPAVAHHLFGAGGAVLVLIMLFMAIVSTGSAEAIAVSSLVAYDIYRPYFNPKATGEDILRVSRIIIVVFLLFMGALSVLLHEMGLNLGWVYLFMGIAIGSAVAPLWNMMTWKDASATGAVCAALGGSVCSVTTWMITASIQSGSISIDTLGTNEAMLAGNVVALTSSAIIHYVMSKMNPQDFDWKMMNEGLILVEQDMSGLDEDNSEELKEASIWIKKRGYLLSFILIVVWPLASIPAGVFSKSYFALWVLLAVMWGFGSALTISILPIYESWDDITTVLCGMFGISKVQPKPKKGQKGYELAPVKEKTVEM